MSVAEVFSEWYSNRWMRNSIHSDMGILRESNIVPVSGVKRLWHPRHMYLWIPLGPLPCLAKSRERQCGQSRIGIELTNATSSGEGFLCFCSYHSKTVDSMSLSSSPLSLLPDQENCRSDEKRGLLSLSFICLAVGSSGGACQDRQVNLPQSPGRVIDAHPSLGEGIIPRSESHHPFAN